MHRPVALGLAAAVALGVVVYLFSGGAAGARHAVGMRTWTIDYRAHDGQVRPAYVLLPAWYGPRRDPPLPLIISPHGRGVDGRMNVRLWTRVAASGRFAVVNPDGEGRRLALYSWGDAGQIADLARMPTLVRRALPWLRLARDSTYAIGGSMGGQEALLLLARAPRLLEGAAVVDPTTNLALQYREFPELPCGAACRRTWKGAIGPGLQRLAQIEVGGTPRQAPAAYAARSPIHFVRQIARSGVPLGLWWSRRDRVVGDPRLQEGGFLRVLERLHPRARVLHVVGSWPHDRGLALNLAAALAWLHLSLAPRSR